MSDLPHMVSVALQSSSTTFDAVLMVSNDSRKVRSIVEVLPANLPLRVMTSLSRVRDALVEHQIDAEVLEEGLSTKGYPSSMNCTTLSYKAWVNDGLRRVADC